MTEAERPRVLDARKRAREPWHSPPHRDLGGDHRCLITAACDEHVPIMGTATERMAEREAEVPRICRPLVTEIHAWCVLPNHCQVLLQAERITQLRHALGRFHRRSSHRRNG